MLLSNFARGHFGLLTPAALAAKPVRDALSVCNNVFRFVAT